MNDESSIVKFIYELMNRDIKIFLDEGGIKVSLLETQELKKAEKSFIQQNREGIISLLKNNCIYSDKYSSHIIRTNLTQYVLSYGQERLWFIENYEEGTNAYNLPLVFKQCAGVEVDILEKSIRGIISRHEILRTLIKTDNEGNRYQLVLKDNLLQLEISRIKVTSQSELNRELNILVNHIYDLTNEPPIKVCMYEISDHGENTNGSEYYLGIVVHHIAFDGWSIEIFLNELAAFYNYFLKLSTGAEARLDLPELSIQYKDFALWQRSYLSGEKLEKQLDYWQSKIEGYEALNIATDMPRPRQIDYSGEDIYFELDEARSNSLRELAKELKVSLYSLLLAGYYLMLRAYSQQDDIVIGTPVANRHYNNVENLIGFFVNSLALRVQIDSNLSLVEFIQYVSHEVMEAQLHQDLPFEKLVEKLNLAKDTSRHPIFQVMFGVQSFRPVINNDLWKEHFANLYQVAKFDITTFIDDSQVCLRGSFNYAVSLYKEETIRSFIETYIQILKEFGQLRHKIYKVEHKISTLNYLRKEEYQKIIYEWNATEREYPREKTIQDLFEEQVESAPDSIAVVYEETRLTYRELNERANQLAHYLIFNHEINPDSLVALCLDRSEYMLIGILGVLKAGGAYVPIDPSYPDDRIRYILEDTKACVVISNESYKERLEDITNNFSREKNASNAIKTEPTKTSKISKTSNINNISIIAIDIETIKKELSIIATSNPVMKTNNRNLAYIIYTSGTTGKPKGVMIEHKGVVNLIQWQKNYFSITTCSRISQFASFGFDGAVGEIFMALLNGACLITIARDLDTEQIIEKINKYNINVVVLVPSLLKLLDLKYSNDLTIVSVGEECSSDIAKHYSHCCNFINAYGPTEYTVYSHAYNVSDSINSINSIVPIGFPIMNTKSYILDLHGNPVPIGVVGEVFISGIGIARGYLDKPELTLEKFVYNHIELKYYYTECGKLECISAQNELMDFEQKNQNYLITNPYRNTLSKSELEQVINSLDNDLKTASESILLKFTEAYTMSGELRYINEANFNSYASCGINSDILQKILPFDSFQGLSGVDFGFGNGEIFMTLKAMGANIMGFDINPLFVQKMRNNEMPAYLLAVDCELDEFQRATYNILYQCDFVISTLILDRVENPKNFLVNFLSVLKSGGKFALQTLLPIIGVDDSEIDFPITYTPNCYKITQGVNAEQDKINLLGLLVELGAREIAIYQIPYKVVSSDGLQHYWVWSFCGSKPYKFPQVNHYLRMYKTGDLARYLPDGNIEYTGRNDFQVKIRGYRIELSEIESVLLDYVGIKQSVVLAKERLVSTGSVGEIDESSSRYLVGYYVANGRLDEEDLRKYLESKLPEYMVPSVFVQLDKLPLTINGKLDRKALPDPEFRSNEDNYIAPRNDIEEQVSKIWAEVLNLPIENVGIRDDFFRLGGDSIISIQLVSRLRQRLGLQISIKDIFSYKTIEKLYENVLAKNIKVEVRSEQGILEGGLGLLPIQEWFFASNYPNQNYWNQSFIVKTHALDIEKLKESINKLLRHHDSLRLRYKKDTTTNKNYIQYYNKEISDREIKSEFRLKLLDIRTLVKETEEVSEEFNEKLEAILSEWQSGFNIEEGPLWSIGYIYGYSDGSARLYFALHHLIVDAVSWRILLEDLERLYQGKELGYKGSSYRQWVEVVKEYARTHQEEKSYWEGVLRGYEEKQLYSLQTIKQNKVDYGNIELSEEETGLLLKESNRAYNTEINDLLLTALGYALAEITKNSVNHIVLEGHGREEIDSSIDITKTVGWFTSMYPVKLEIKDDIAESIKSIKENLRRVPNKGIGYGAVVGYGNGKLPRISFNYLGQFNKTNEEENKAVRTAAKSWYIVGELSGRSIDERNADYNIININGLVIEGRLQFNITSKLGKENTNRLGEVFKEQLKAIALHTKDSRSYLTVSDIDKIISQEYLDRIQERQEIEGVYLANSLQQGFIYHALNQGEIDDAYRVQFIWEYHSKIDVDKLREAWLLAQQRYATLRLRFAWDEELVQIIDKQATLDWRYTDLTKIQSVKVQELKIIEVQKADRSELYNLKQGNLFRVYLIKQKEDIYRCIFSNHHSILDGWSTPILIEYVHQTYLELQAKKPINVTFDNGYCATQNYLQEHQHEHKNYWQEYLSKIDERGELNSLLYTDSKVRISEYKNIKEPAEVKIIIKDNLYDDLKALSYKEGVTLNSIFQYVWHKILSIYTNNNQTIVGTTVSGRNLPIEGIENSVGLHINTLPLIVEHNKVTKNIITAIKDIQDNINELNSKSSINLAELQQGGNRLFDSLFVYENYPSPINYEHNIILKLKFKDAVEKLDYSLVAIVYELNNSVSFKIKYAGELFSRDKIDHILLTIEKLLRQIVTNYNKPIFSLNCLEEKEKNRLINTWNQTDLQYPINKTIHQLFEERVHKSKDSTALICEDKQLTYSELNNKANKLASYIKSLGKVEPDHVIGICLDRSELMVIAVLAVLKAGGAYVPIGPTYPDDRIRYILEDTQVKIVLTSDIYRARLAKITKSKLPEFRNQLNINILALDTRKLEKTLLLESENNLYTGTQANNLAYIIYTSGTTGNPKGTMIENTSCVVRILSMIDSNKMSSNDVLLFKTNIVFDVAFSDIFTTLLSGATLNITRESFDINEIKNKLNSNSFNICHFVPSQFEIIRQELDFNNFPKLNKLMFSGEPLDQSKLSFLVDKAKMILNYYGPTETGEVTLNQFKINELTQNQSYSVIGKPISETKCYVLDDKLNLLPIGVIGELYIGGAGLARGYLNKPDFTAEKFIANPFQSKEERSKNKNWRLYRTGDLVRWSADGSLEYIGRNDFQVKIRGYRIELGEIESVLTSYNGISQGAVVSKERIGLDNIIDKYLVGYYVAEDKLEEEEILSYLRSKLPEYMVPTALISLSNLPLTVNGKLDRTALPDLELTNLNSCYVEPRDESEVKIRSIWAEVLGLSETKISIYDDFFKLGGNSISAIRMVSKLNSQHSRNSSISTIFKHRTIKQLAEYLSQENFGWRKAYNEEWEV